MPTTCKINFENHQKFVYSGQKLRITVRLKLTEELKVRGIHIHLRGKTHVRFFLCDDCKQEGSYIANEDVLDMENCLQSGNDGEFKLLPGTYDYSFQCTLPQELPSSFQGYSGHVKYTAQVVLNIPRWADKTFKQSFIVYKPRDLNNFPSLQNEVIVQKDLTIEMRRGYNNYSAGPFKISARIAAGGYVPHQTINVEFDVSNNDTQQAIVSFYVRLFRKIIYFKSQNSKHQKISYANLNEQFATGCQQKQHKKFNIYLKVPQTPPTDTETSKLIKIEYFVQILGYMGYNQKNFRIILPITIGTEPFHGSTPGIYILHGRQTVLPSAPELLEQIEPTASQLPDDDTVSIRTYASTPPPFPDDELDLPTYDEAILLNLDDDIDLNLESIQYSFSQLYTKR